MHRYRLRMTSYDVLIRGGLVLDGSGGPGSVADVGIADGRIAVIDDLSATTTILFTDQSVHFALKHAQRAYILEKGRIRFSGTIAELEANTAVRDQYLAV